MDRTALHIAAERGHTHIVEVLVDKYRANVAARTKDGSTLIHIASQFGHPDTALAFLKKGVPLHMPNKVCSISYRFLRFTSSRRTLRSALIIIC